MKIHSLALIALALSPLTARAQSAETTPTDLCKLPTHANTSECIAAQGAVKTIFLANVSSQTEANEIMVAVRNSFRPDLHIYLVTSPSALVINTNPEEFAKIEALVHSLDRPHKTFRLTYTITELDAGKTLGTAHIAMVVVDGQPNTVKQGDKIPVATGSFSTDNNSAQTQFTYLDIGLNFSSTVTALESGAILKSKVEQSSLGQPSTIAGVTEPVVRQTVLEGSTFLTLGKPVMIGSIDVPNSTHRFDIAVVMDAIH